MVNTHPNTDQRPESRYTKIVMYHLSISYNYLSDGKGVLLDRP